MKTIDLTQPIKEADGQTNYTFGGRREQADGKQVNVVEQATFQKLLNTVLREIKLRREPKESVEQFEQRTQAFLSLSEKVAMATPDSEFSEDEITIMKTSLSGFQSVVYGQFLRLCS